MTEERQQMKIAFDHQIFCAQPYGGISRYFVSTAKSLLEMGHDLQIFAPLYLGRYLAELPPATVHGMSIDKHPPRTSRIFSLINHSIAKWQIGRWRPDVVHETYYSRMRTAPDGIPSVVTVYDMIHEVHPETLLPGDRASENKRAAVERADHVICISDSTRNDLIRLFNVPEKKVSTVYLAAGSFMASDTERPRQNQRSYLLYVGARGGYKNFSGLISAVAGSRLKFDFDIVAFGGPDFSDAERQMIASHGFASDQVRHVGNDDAGLGNYYAGASAFVYPSLYEGFGIPPLEAMSHDCPVVSSNTSSMPEIIGDAGEFFPPTDLDAMAKAIESVVYSETHRNNLIIRGRDRLKKFSWEKCAQQTLTVYQNLQG